MSVIEFAEKRMMEEAKAGEEQNVLYWAAYLDGARAQKSETIERLYKACLDGRVMEGQE